MAGKTEDGLLEDCVCPICFDVYGDHVFKCVNGHAVCNTCVKPLSACPQCRISYKGAPIRVRVLENMLDRMSFDCKFKENGCNLKLKRADLSSHIDTCEYGGTSVDLCHILGLFCTKKTNTQNILEALGHLMCDHQINMEENLNRFNLQIKMLPSKYHWNPVMFETADPNSRVIVSFATSTNFGSTSLRVLGVRLRVNPNAAFQKIELEFKFTAKNKVIVRKQEVDDIENCDAWTCSQLIEFREEIAKHTMQHGLRVECTVLVNGKSVPTSASAKQIKLTKVCVYSTSVKNQSMQLHDRLSIHTQALERLQIKQ